MATSTTGTLPRQQFTGQERDGEVGVDYFGARLYVPQHGRMPSVDPLYVGAVENPQRWNRYAYALNAPGSLIDPDGRNPNQTTCAGKSNGFVDKCKDGGARPGAVEPALNIGHSEHSVDLFLLMQYGDWGYGTGGRGGAIDVNEWNYATQKPDLLRDCGFSAFVTEGSRMTAHRMGVVGIRGRLCFGTSQACQFEVAARPTPP